MSESKHTPEPWFTRSYAPYLVINTESWQEDTVKIVDCRRGAPPICYTEEEAANARRIVAAVNACAGIPTQALEQGVIADLLAACERALPWIHGRYVNNAGKELFDQVQSAIAKAKGDTA